MYAIIKMEKSMLSNNKKLSPLCILEVLKESSDENHPLRQEQIIQKLYNRFGLELERKSVGATIDSLIDFGFDIVKTKNGCYLDEREFEKSEISYSNRSNSKVSPRACSFFMISKFFSPKFIMLFCISSFFFNITIS